MIEIIIDDREILDVLADLRGRLDDMTPAMEAIGMELEARISRRFEDTTDPNGDLWKARPSDGLYPWDYDKHYPKDGNRRLLDRSGDLLDSLNYQANRDSVTVGFGEDYAAYHEFGTKHMQRRGILFSDPNAGTLGDEDRASILDLLSRYFSA